MLRLLLLANVGLLAAACSGSPQIAAPTPKPTPTSTAPAPPVTSTSGSWIITLTTLSDTGPTFCIHQPSVGSTFSTDYQLVFGGDTVEFVPPDPIDWDSFTAKVDGLNFSGANPPVGSGTGMCAHYLQASTIAGTFSPDHSSFTARVTWSFTLDSGEVETIAFSWTGTRRG